jgi:hypothetical protein
MICIELSVGNPYLFIRFHPNLNTIHNLLISNHQITYISSIIVGIPCARTAFCDGTRLIDATYDRLEVTSS